MAKFERSDAVNKFKELCEKHSDEQCEFFLKSFIFALGDDWKEVPRMCKLFKQQARDSGETEDWMNHIQASNFLQKEGKTRTGTERKKELEDVDITQDGRISFVEYLMLHYKVMILQEFYKRREEDIVEDLSNDGIGLVGVGDKLLEELLSMPAGLSKELEEAIESFTAKKKEREAKVKKFEEKAALGGIKGMAAQNELKQLENQDTTEMNRVELTLAAAKRKASKMAGDEALKEKQDALKEQVDREAAEKKARLKARAAMFEKKA